MSLAAGFVICLHFILIKYQMFLEKLGLLVVKHPTKVIIAVFLLLAGVSCLGFLFMSPANLQEEFFMSEKNHLVEEFFDSGAIFPINKLQTRKGDFNSNGRKEQ